MKINYMTIGILVILFITYLEYLYAKNKSRKDVFKYESSIANLSVGVADRLFDIFCSTVFYSVYYQVYDRWHLFNIGNAWYVWIILLMATDLVWYWYHRFGHEVNILWAAHIVHHHSEEYNYTAAMRVTVFQAVVRTAFWAILPLIGFQPQMVIPILLVHAVYSFFTHTRLVGKLGLIEKIMITPSHHRVHHASDEKYLDKNYGDIFVFWDKLFGTFKLEEEEPQYGIVHPLNSHSFLWQHFHYYLEIALAVQRAQTWEGKWKAIFGGPANMSPAIRKVLEKKFRVKKEAFELKKSLKRYVNIQVGCSILLTLGLMMFYYYVELPLVLLLSALILLSLINCGALLDQKKYVFYLEVVRFVIPFVYLAWLFNQPILILLAGGVGLLLLEKSVRHRYQKFLFDQQFMAKVAS